MNRKVYAYLLATYGRLPQFWVSMALVIVQTVLMRVVSVIIIARLAGQVATGDLEGAKISVLAYLGVAIVGLAARLSKELIATLAENRQYDRLAVAYYKKMVGKDMAFFRDHQTGYLAGTFRQHVDSALDLIRLIRGDLIQTPISLIIPTIVLFFVSWQVGVAALGVVVAQIIYISWASSIANIYRSRTHEIYRKISGVFSDDMTNIVAYKTSGSNHGAKTISKLAAEEVQLFWRRRKVLAILDTPRDFITVLGTALAFWLVINSSSGADTTVGLVVLTVTYMFQIFQNVSNIPDLIAKHDDLVTRLYPTLDYLTDRHETIRDPKEPRPLRIKKAAINISQVSFSYPDDRGHHTPVFTNLDLYIKGGEQIGVVGLSGAGKSTLASLLMRFDDVTGGVITIDGTDIRDVRQADLRSHIAYVPQEPLLFHRTIRENLQYFGGDVSEDLMIRAAKAAHAHEFISKLPAGYDTLVGERGIKLSGGQKQRVVIARAILKNAPIMLFDEATSALDSESERIIQKALPTIIGKRTAIVIAHRLSTIAGLDRIIVMHDGMIVEQGTHRELLALQGRYHSLWQKQTAGR
ncbi:MAG TPA: ABC transporter ATP-binding protein [Magnetospirillaceae bacterium]|nr:ABC transporter ATP-binding protein [Magnetospirillaceae bacterium]